MPYTKFKIMSQGQATLWKSKSVVNNMRIRYSDMWKKNLEVTYVHAV